MGGFVKNQYKRMKVNGRCIDEHRFVVERHLGRKLASNEVVHHRNGDKRDNRLENLEVMTRLQHLRHHGFEALHSVEARQKTANMLRGKRPRIAPLSDESVRAIRRDVAMGIGPTRVSQIHGIHKSTVIGITKCRRYAYVL